METKSEDQTPSQDNKPISTSMWRDESVPAFSTSMWRDESVGTNGTEWEHLRILMEQERQNKKIKSVEVYKCSITERYTEEETK